MYIEIQLSCFSVKKQTIFVAAIKCQNNFKFRPNFVKLLCQRKKTKKTVIERFPSNDMQVTII